MVVDIKYALYLCCNRSRISVALERCQTVEQTNQRVRRVTVELSDIQARTLQLEALYEQSTDEFIKV